MKYGDIAQLSFDGNNFEHTLVIVDIKDKLDLGKIFVSAHKYDTFGKKINDYSYKNIRFVHILGGRKY